MEKCHKSFVGIRDMSPWVEPRRNHVLRRQSLKGRTGRTPARRGKFKATPLLGGGLAKFKTYVAHEPSKRARPCADQECHRYAAALLPTSIFTCTDCLFVTNGLIVLITIDLYLRKPPYLFGKITFTDPPRRYLLCASIMHAQNRRVYAVQHAKLFRCEVGHENAATTKNSNVGEKKEGLQSVIPVHYIISWQFRAAKFRALYCTIDHNDRDRDRDEEPEFRSKTPEIENGGESEPRPSDRLYTPHVSVIERNRRIRWAFPRRRANGCTRDYRVDAVSITSRGLTVTLAVNYRVSRAAPRATHTPPRAPRPDPLIVHPQRSV
ncbi:hypothetical protein EVAR_33764_1 [Eumeta japonica]|uniref:Uncharacterized protein n=1 Tax=Eumeta variegata TaxID=151549 RepID=A0A4C1VTY1_EUMVA|nr:hypothetical protein EVAR_33764_1 [Eumeta japonica]